MPDISLRDLIDPSDKQEAFFAAVETTPFVLYGGAKGGGKSHALRWLPIKWLMRWARQGHRNVRAMLACEDYPTLWDRHISKVRAGAYPSWLGEYHEQSHEFRLRPEHGGGVVCFRNLDDPSKYDGSEFPLICVDELAKNPESTFHALRSCMRWPGIDERRFAAGTNPIGIGLAWVRKLWIERDFSDTKLDPEKFAFVQATAKDNPHLPDDYWDDLQTLPEQLRRAYAEGDWYVFEGQFFADFRRDLHVTKDFEIPVNWPRWASVDYGTTPLRPTFAALWWAQQPETGRRFITRELYAKGLNARDQAYEILRWTGDEALRYVLADPAMFNKNHETGVSPSDVYRELGLVLARAYNDRRKGWDLVRQGLQVREDGLPGIQIFERCKNLIRTLPLLIFDEHNPEDLDTTGEDHLADALRYGVSRGEIVSLERGPRRPARSPWSRQLVALR